MIESLSASEPVALGDTDTPDRSFGEFLAQRGNHSPTFLDPNDDRSVSLVLCSWNR